MYDLENIFKELFENLTKLESQRNKLTAPSHNSPHKSIAERINSVDTKLSQLRKRLAQLETNSCQVEEAWRLYQEQLEKVRNVPGESMHGWTY